MICEIYVYNRWNDISPNFHQKTIDFYLLKWYNIGVKRKCGKHSTEVKDMKRQAYKVTFYNTDSNTTEYDIIYAVSEANAHAWADMMCMKEQEVESVEIYHA